MKVTYKLCKILAVKRKLTAEMLDVYLAAERITAEQYLELINLIDENTPLPEPAESNTQKTETIYF